MAVLAGYTLGEHYSSPTTRWVPFLGQQYWPGKEEVHSTHCTLKWICWPSTPIRSAVSSLSSFGSFYLLFLPCVLLLLEALLLRVLIYFLQQVCDLQLHQNLSSPQKSNHLYRSNFNQNIY